MGGDDSARLLYLIVLFLAVAGAGFALLRRAPGRGLAIAGVWLMLFLGLVALHGLWSDIRAGIFSTPRQSLSQSGADGAEQIVLQQAADGHYYMTLQINDVPVRFIVDTGASDIVLSPRDAERVGIDLGGLAYVGRAQTANGLVATAPVRLDRVALGQQSDRGLRATVTQGAMGESLLGMAYLQRFARIEIAAGRMVLVR